MVKEYLTYEDMRMRLHNNIVFYKGEPYVIDCSNVPYPNIELKYLTKPASTYKEISHKDEVLDTSTPPLGYMNRDKQAIYLTRLPSRRQSQGLRSDLISASPPTLNNYVNTNNFYNCLMGKYPSTKEALSVVQKEGAYSIAIHRDFAISLGTSQTIVLHFKERVVGFYNSNNNKFDIISSPEASWINRLVNKHGLLKA